MHPLSDVQETYVLLVDDDALDRRAVRRSLGSNYVLLEANTGEQALAHLQDQAPDCVLLDYQVPGTDTLDLLETCVQAQLPVIMLTGAGNEAIAVEAMKRGAQDYLTKDQISTGVLGRMIAHVTEKASLKRQLLEQELEESKEREREITELKHALAVQQNLTGWQESATTGHLYGSGPLHARLPDMFAELQTAYESLLDHYLEALAFKETPTPHGQISALADRLGALGSGPRDLVDLHLRAVTAKTAEAQTKRAKAYMVEGRLLALEVMGNLVDYYRMRRALSPGERKEG